MIRTALKVVISQLYTKAIYNNVPKQVAYHYSWIQLFLTTGSGRSQKRLLRDFLELNSATIYAIRSQRETLHE